MAVKFTGLRGVGSPLFCVSTAWRLTMVAVFPLRDEFATGGIKFQNPLLVTIHDPVSAGIVISSSSRKQGAIVGFYDHMVNAPSFPPPGQPLLLTPSAIDRLPRLSARIVNYQSRSKGHIWRIIPSGKQSKGLPGRRRRI